MDGLIGSIWEESGNEEIMIRMYYIKLIFIKKELDKRKACFINN